MAVARDRPLRRKKKAKYSSNPIQMASVLCFRERRGPSPAGACLRAYKGVRQGEPRLAVSRPAMAPPSPRSRQAVEVRPGDHSARKWCMPLREDVFGGFFSRGGEVVRAVFGEGSLFSPMLFGKFFDPADAFPLWDFESEVLLAGLREAVKSKVDWSETDAEYVFRAELPGIVKNDLAISLEKGRVIEISGQWRGRESNRKDWRTEHWWEYGYVRRLELPEDADQRKTAAHIEDDVFLEMRIPKKPASSDDDASSDPEEDDDT